MSRSLAMLPSPPLPDDQRKIAAYEHNAQLVYLSCDSYETFRKTTLANYPTIDCGITAIPNFNKSFSREHSTSVFARQTSDNLAYAIRNVWLQRGFIETVNYLRSVECGGGVVGYMCSAINKICSAASFIHSSLPWMISKSSTPESLISCVDTFHWRQSWIKCFAWHTSGKLFAVSFQNDYIRVYSLSTTCPVGSTGPSSPCASPQKPVASEKLVWILRHPQQNNVTCLAWKSLSPAILAVSCDNCILIWHLDGQQLIKKPSAACAQVVSSHTFPISTLEWSPDGGKYLAFGGPNSREVGLHNFFTDSTELVAQFFSHCVSRVLWSPDGSKLCVLFTGASLRVYDCETWISESWSNFPGRCRSAVWSYDGSIMLFCCQQSSTLFALSFVRRFSSVFSSQNRKPEILIGGSLTAFPVFDFSPVSFSTSAKMVCGGEVQSLAWDPYSDRLAVTFKERPEYVALFRTLLRPMLNVQPIGWIKSPFDAAAELIRFQSKTMAGSVLCIVWSNNILQYVPLIYSTENRPVPTDVSMKFSSDAVNITSEVQGTPVLFSR